MYFACIYFCILYAADMTKEIGPPPTAAELEMSNVQYPVYLSPSAFYSARAQQAHIGANPPHIRAIIELVRPINEEVAQTALNGIAFIIRSGERHHRTIGNWDTRWDQIPDHMPYYDAAQLTKDGPVGVTKGDIIMRGYPTLEFMLEDLHEPTGDVVTSKLLEHELVGRFASLAERVLGIGLAAKAARAVEQAKLQALYPIGIAMPEAS
jgi:hypothetical protein